MSETVAMMNEVVLKPLKKASWLEPGHDGEIRYSNTFEVIVPERAASTGGYITGLNAEQEREFEEKLFLAKGTLSRYNKTYWGDFKIKVSKNGAVLDLNDPIQQLQHIVLKSHRRVAKSKDESLYNPYADYIMYHPEEDIKLENEKSRERRKAIQKFTAMSTEEMVEFLIVSGNKVSTDNKDFIESAVDKVVMDNPKLFLDTLADPSFKTKIFINKLLVNKLINKNGTKYTLPGGDTIGLSLSETVDYLGNPANQDVYISLKSKLASKK